MKKIRLGMIGLDTSHVSHFAALLHDQANPHHIPGARIEVAFAGGSEDFPPSINRVTKFTEELRDQHQVAIVDCIDQLKGRCDAILIESVDGRVHRGQFEQVAAWNVPVYIDKPFTVSSSDAKAIADLAKEHKTPVMTASAIRYAQPFRAALGKEEGGAVTGGDFYGPMALQEQSPGYFWYGIHCVEMLYATLGTGCREVTASREGAHDFLVGKWADGRIGTIRGNRTGNNGFGGVVHREKKSSVFDVSTTTTPYYASLLGEIVRFFTSDEVLIPMEESLETIAFIEAANRSCDTGETVHSV